MIQFVIPCIYAVWKLFTIQIYGDIIKIQYKILPFFRDQMRGIFVVHIDFQEDKTGIFYDIYTFSYVYPGNKSGNFFIKSGKVRIL